MSLSEDLLSSVDIIDIIGKHVQLKKSGSNFVGLCPFHNEKSPSFSVSQNKQIFKCFGCGLGGNALKFVMEYEKVDFWDAVKLLAEENKFDLKPYQKKQTYQSKTNTASDQQSSHFEFSAETKEKLKYMNKITNTFFVEELQNSPTAVEYLTSKRKLNADMIEKFQLGYAPDNYYTLITLLKKKGFTDQDIIESGLGKQGNTGELYSFFRNRITFPIRDHMDNVVGFGARAMSPEDMPKYLNSSETILYEKSKILYGINFAKKQKQRTDSIVIVEGYMDVIGFHRLGVESAVATCGTSLTGEHIKLCKRYGSNIYFLFDNDKAGFEASIRGLKLCLENDTYPKLLQLPATYKDVDECANALSNEEKETFFASMQAESIDVMSDVIEKILSEIVLFNPVEKNKALNKLFEVLIHTKNYNMLDHYLQMISNRTKTMYEMLLTQFRTYTKTDGKLQIRQNQKESDIKKIYQPNKDFIFASLFFQDFLDNQVGKENSKSEDLKSIIQSFSKIDDTFITSKVLSETLSEEEKNELLSCQLRREQHLTEISDPIKKQEYIFKHMLGTINTILTHLLKTTTLNQQEKQNLLELKKKIIK